MSFCRRRLHKTLKMSHIRAGVLVACLYGPATLGAEADGAPGFEASAGRDDTRVELLVEDDTLVVGITSRFGIDRITITRLDDKWPAAMLVRMHLKGLESFRATAGKSVLAVSVSSTTPQRTILSLSSNGQELEVRKNTPTATAVRIVGEVKAIPLQNGHFMVWLPVILFENNPEEIRLEWIDFYRD